MQQAELNGTLLLTKGGGHADCLRLSCPCCENFAAEVNFRGKHGDWVLSKVRSRGASLCALVPTSCVALG